MNVIGQQIKPCTDMNTICFDPAKVAKWAAERVMTGTVTHPSQRLTDPAFKYVPACATDLAETFRRVREQQRQAEVKYIHVVINNMPEQSK